MVKIKGWVIQGALNLYIKRKINLCGPLEWGSLYCSYCMRWKKVQNRKVQIKIAEKNPVKRVSQINFV